MMTLPRKDVGRDAHLQRQLAQLHAVYAAMHDGLLVFDARGRVVFVNEAAARVIGFANTNEMMHKLAYYTDLFELRDMEGRPLPIGTWPVSRALRGERVANVEYAVRRKDTGQEWFVRFSSQPVLDAHGDLDLVVLISSDVTDRVLREQALRVSEERARALADSMPQLVWTADASGALDYCNARASEYAGLEPGPDGTWTWRAVVHPEDLGMTLDAWSTAIESHRAFECEHRVRMRDGSFRWHVSRARVVQSEHGDRWFGSTTDIHEHRLAEDNLRRAMDMRDQVMSVVAHDLRNPLGVVRMSLPLLRELLPATPDEKARHQAEQSLCRLERQVMKMEKLVDEVLDAATLQAGHPLRLERRRCDLVAVVRELVAEQGREGVNPRVELASAPEQLEGDWDADRLQRVVANLISNALKYSPADSSVLVEIEAAPGRAVVRVRDRGMGIAVADQARIFDWFARAENAQRATKGIGIGLAGARRIVEQHGGTLTVESALNVGSTFTVMLPWSGMAAGVANTTAPAIGLEVPAAEPSEPLLVAALYRAPGATAPSAKQ